MNYRTRHSRGRNEILIWSMLWSQHVSELTHTLWCSCMDYVCNEVIGKHVSNRDHVRGASVRDA